MSNWELSRADVLQRGLVDWSRTLSDADRLDQRYRNALEEIDKALIDTIEYMDDRRRGKPENRKRERALTDLWMSASRTLSPIDPQLSRLCVMKGMGWTAPAYWETAHERGYKIGIYDMEEARAALAVGRQEAVRHSVPRWFSVVGAVFTAITVLILMYLLVGPPLDSSRKVIFDAFLAFSVAASAAFLGGTAAAHGVLPMPKSSPVRFSAVGGVGVFVVVFLILRTTT